MLACEFRISHVIYYSFCLSIRSKQALVEHKCNVMIKQNKNKPKAKNQRKAFRGNTFLKELKAAVATRQNRGGQMMPNKSRKQKRGMPGKLMNFAGSNNRVADLSNVVGTSQGQGFGNKKRIIVEESEYIGEVLSLGSDLTPAGPYTNVYVLPCNPGQAMTFPWLYTIAKNYEKYRFLALKFIYKPEVTEFSVTGSNTGKVILSADYDASDAPPSSKQQQEDTDPHTDGMPYQSILLSLDPSEMHRNSDAKYVRPAGLPGSADIKTYDCANFTISVQGQSGNVQTLGELHVSYIVELSVPVLENNVIQAPLNYSVTWYQNMNLQAASNSIQLQLLLDDTIVNGLSAVNTAGAIVLTPGNYMIDYTVRGTTTLGSNLTELDADLFYNGTTVWNFLPHFSSSVGGESFEVYGSAYVSTNGTASVQLFGKAFFSTGGVNLVGTMRIVAI